MNEKLYKAIIEKLSAIVKTEIEKNNVLNEGQFSWFTQDTDEQIGCEDGNRIHVVMSDLEGNQWPEDNYEGYGVFGGKDYYELMAEMNGFGKYTDDTDTLREIGIALEFNNEFQVPGTNITVKSKNNVFQNPETGELQQILFPALTTDGNGKRYIECGEKPETDPNQGWLMQDDSDDDYYDEEY